MSTIRLRYSVLLVSIILILSGLTLKWTIQSNFGTVNTTEIIFPTEEGVLIQANLHVPITASSSNQLPGVVVIHGMAASKEFMSAINNELARHGFVVLSIDTAGSGNSDLGVGILQDRGGTAAAKYLDALPYVNKIGFVGHSMGAFISIQAVYDSQVQIDGLVLIAGGVGFYGVDGFNSTYPNNVLVAVGAYDELYQIPELLDSLVEPFGASGSVEVGEVYGDFSDGSARMVIIPPSNHLLEPIDPIIIRNTIDWLKSSLIDTEITAFGPADNLIYPLFILGGLISSTGLLLSIFPLCIIVLDMDGFSKLKQSPRPTQPTAKRRRLLLITVYGLIGVLTFPVLAGAGFIIPFPQTLGGGFCLWLLGSATIAIFVLRYLIRNKDPEQKWQNLGFDKTDIQSFFKILGSHSLPALIVFGWLLLWVHPVDWLLALDFRAFIPILNDLTLHRLIIVPLYLIFTIPFFIVEGIWLVGFLSPRLQKRSLKSYTSWGLSIAAMKCIPYVIVIAIQYLPILILGDILIQNILAFILLFLIGSLPIFVVTSALLAWSYQLTNRIYIGAILNALIFSWNLASILPFII